jgi:hypothetical protein
MYSCARDFPPRLYSPAVCKGMKLKNEVGHHLIRDPGFAHLPKVETTGPTTSTHNSLKASTSFASLLLEEGGECIRKVI